MEWTPARIRLFRETGLCLPQDKFAKALGFTKRTIGNAERGTHPPSLALRRALDEALEKTSDAQRTRFLTAAEHGNTPLVHPSRDRQALGSRESQVGSAATNHPLRTLDGLRNAVLDTPPPVAQESETYSAAGVMAATVEAHRLYHLADYDAAAQLLPTVLTCLQSRDDIGPDEHLVGTLTGRHAAAVAYLVAAKLATKLGDVGLASVTADRAMRTAKETEHPALIGAAIYQVSSALLLTGELAGAEQILTGGVESIATVSATRYQNCREEEVLSVRGSLLLLLAIIAARQGDHRAAQKFLLDAGRLAEQLAYDGNWLWTAFGRTNVDIHQLSVHSLLGNGKQAVQVAEVISVDSLPAVLRGRRSQVHLELGWVAAAQADDALAVLHLLEAERLAEQSVSRNKSARRLIGILLARESRIATPGLRGLASRTGLLL